MHGLQEDIRRRTGKNTDQASSFSQDMQSDCVQTASSPDQQIGDRPDVPRPQGLDVDLYLDRANDAGPM